MSIAPGTHAGLLQLCDGARRLHRPARVRRAHRPICRPAYLRAARHDAIQLPPAASGQPETSDVEGLQPWQRQADRIRIRRASSCRKPYRQRCGHGPLHDRAPAKWREDPAARDCPADAQHCQRADPGPERNGARLLSARTSTATGSSPTAATPMRSTATCTCSSTMERACTYRSTAAARKVQRRRFARRCSTQFADRYFPAAPTPQAKIDPKTARANAELLVGSWGSSRRAFSSFVSIADLLGQTQISVDKDGTLHAPVAEVLGLRPFKWVPVGPSSGATPTATKCSARKSRTERRPSSASTASRRSW